MSGWTPVPSQSVFVTGLIARPGRDEHVEVFGDLAHVAGVRPAAGRLADDLRAVLRLEIVGALLRAGERVAARQHEDVLSGIALAREPGQRPELVRLVLRPEVQVVQVDRLRVEQVAAEELHHVGLAASVLPQVDDQRVRVGQEAHRRLERLAGELGRGEHPQVEVAEVPGQDLDPLEAEVVPAEVLLRPRESGSRGLRARGPSLGPDPQVLVMADRLQVFRERAGEGLGVLAPVVASGLRSPADGSGQSLADLGEHVGLLQRLGELRDRLLPLGGGQRVRGLRDGRGGEQQGEREHGLPPSGRRSPREKAAEKEIRHAGDLLLHDLS